MNAPPGDPLAEPALDRLTRAAFTSVQFREGYTKGEVEAFVGRATEALASPVPTLRPEEVRAIRFSTVRLQQGYEMREVDTYLDDLEQHLAERLRDQPRAEGREPGDADLRDGPAPPRDLRSRLVLAWRTTSISGRLSLLAMVAGVVVSLLVGLWPGAPSTRISLVFGVIISIALSGLVIVVAQVWSILVSVIGGVVFVGRRLRSRVRAREEAPQDALKDSPKDAQL